MEREHSDKKDKPIGALESALPAPPHFRKIWAQYVGYRGADLVFAFLQRDKLGLSQSCNHRPGASVHRVI